MRMPTTKYDGGSSIREHIMNDMAAKLNSMEHRYFVGLFGSLLYDFRHGRYGPFKINYNFGVIILTRS
jgi:hypothetical protein